MKHYEFNLKTIANDLVILLSLFNASKSSSELLRSHNLKMLSFIEWEIIKEKLISTAIQLRMLDDSHEGSVPQVDCLRWLNSSGDTNLREACNKIIHARNIELLRSARCMVLKDEIYLEGKKGADQWEVHLQIKNYIVAGLTFLNKFFE